MNKKNYAGFAGVALVALLIVSTSAFNQNAPAKQNTKDTIPKERNIRDLDEAMKELDRSMEKLELELSKQDWSKIDKDIKEAMKGFDAAKIQAEVDKAMKEIDFAKMKIDISNAMKEVDGEKIKKEIQESIAKIDMEKIKLEMEKVKDIDLSAMQAELKKIQPEIEKSLQEAKKNIEKAKVEIQEYKTFVDDMDKSGLIDKDSNYTIEHKDGELFINGKKQPADVYNKYRTFLEKHKNITIKKSSDDFKINKD